MSTLPAISLEPPRFLDGNVLLLAGLSERYTADQCGANIPAQWQKFGPHLGHVPGQLGSVAYGVCYNFDEAGNMDYLCGVEVTEFSDLPHDFAHLRITPQRYAVFFHAQHISAIRSTWHAIWNEWLPQSGYELADAPFFERYDERFDPSNGNGGVELWIPIHAKKA